MHTSERADCYWLCCAVLLRDQRVTLWCNCEDGNVRHSLRPYRKEKQAHRSCTRGARESALTVLGPRPSSPSAQSQLPHTQSPALAPRHSLRLRRALPQLFPVFVATLPHADYEWTQGPWGGGGMLVVADTFMRPKY